ncbi:MAG: hypothetical protein Q9180_000437 [Flavoplaca navasiana]
MTPTSINSLPYTEAIFQGLNEHGGLQFRQHIHVHVNSEARALPSNALVALGLTEICCGIGRGKVFFIPMPTTLSRERFLKTPNKTEAARAIWGFYRMPRLVYVPLNWGPREQCQWADMTHDDRYQLLNGRAGGLQKEDMCMPIDLIYHADEHETFTINGYVDENAGCKATLAILPNAFVGWHSQFQNEAGPLQMAGGSMDDAGGAWYTVEPRKVKHCSVETGEDVVKALRRMYFAQEPRSLVKFGEVVEGLIRLHENLACVEGSTKTRLIAK